MLKLHKKPDELTLREMVDIYEAYDIIKVHVSHIENILLQRLISGKKIPGNNLKLGYTTTRSQWNPIAHSKLLKKYPDCYKPPQLRAISEVKAMNVVKDISSWIVKSEPKPKIVKIQERR